MNIVMEELGDGHINKCMETLKLCIKNAEAVLAGQIASEHNMYFVGEKRYFDLSVETQREKYRHIFNHSACVSLEGWLPLNWRRGDEGACFVEFDKVLESLNGVSLLVYPAHISFPNQSIYTKLGNRVNRVECYCCFFTNILGAEWRGTIKEMAMNVVHEILNRSEIKYLIKSDLLCIDKNNVIDRYILEEVAFEIGYWNFINEKPFLYIRC